MPLPDSQDQVRAHRLNMWRVHHQLVESISLITAPRGSLSDMDRAEQQAWKRSQRIGGIISLVISLLIVWLMWGPQAGWSALYELLISPTQGYMALMLVTPMFFAGFMASVTVLGYLILGTTFIIGYLQHRLYGYSR